MHSTVINKRSTSYSGFCVNSSFVKFCVKEWVKRWRVIYLYLHSIRKFVNALCKINIYFEINFLPFKTSCFIHELICSQCAFLIVFSFVDQRRAELREKRKVWHYVTSLPETTDQHSSVCCEYHFPISQFGIYLRW